MDSEEDLIEWSGHRWTEIGQPDAEHFAAMAAALRVHQLIAAALDRALRPYDLPRTAYLLLATLQIAPERTRPLGQLSKRLIVHPTTVTLLIDQLERRGLVSRAPHPTDRRTVLATLTDDGDELTRKANLTLAEIGYGLPGVSGPLAITMTEILRQVRDKLGDA